MVANGAKYWQMKDSGKQYIALGTLSGIHEITTKKGDRMAFCKLNDMEGQIDCTFFPKIWEQLKPHITDGDVYAFKGKVDGSRETPSFIIDSIEDATQLENHSATAVHIQLNPSFNNAAAISNLRDFLFDNSGNCSVYFHIDTGNNPFVIKATDQINVTSNPEVIKKLKDINYVKDVWTE